MELKVVGGSLMARHTQHNPSPGQAHISRGRISLDRAVREVEFALTPKSVTVRDMEKKTRKKRLRRLYSSKKIHLR